MDTQSSIQVAEEIRYIHTYYAHTEFTGCYSIHSTLIQGSRGVALLRFILIGECFSHNFQSLEIIGDMYHYTEAFRPYS